MVRLKSRLPHQDHKELVVQDVTKSSVGQVEAIAGSRKSEEDEDKNEKQLERVLCVSETLDSKDSFKM